MTRIRTTFWIEVGSLALTATLILTACTESPFSRFTPGDSVEEPPGGVDGPGGSGEDIVIPSSGTRQKLDILWVVDNSGSMCQEQKALRENFDTFAEAIQRADIDFQLGVTTTQMRGDYEYEPVAKPGHLQSTPQPVPGFDSSCHTALDDAGFPIPGDYTPIKDAIRAAVGCMADPDETYLDPSNADIECALYNIPMGCSIARAGCGGTDTCTSEDIFPPASSYRRLPKVLRSADYRTRGVLDVERLSADIACMTLVGTRGWGIEQGLSAAVRAVDPELTGGAMGADGADASAPNHGLIRENARFALVFITDENDCSHDGSLQETTACGGDVCAFANAVGVSEGASPLIPPSQLNAQLMENLRATKGDPSFSETDILVASIHGNSRRFDGVVPTEAECVAAGGTTIGPTCATRLGVAYSGDRYERFLREFPQSYPAPNPDDRDAPLTGWMCQGDFRPLLPSVGQFFASPKPGDPELDPPVQ